MLSLYQAIDHPRRDSLRDSVYTWQPAESTISVSITALPTHLASAAAHLLVCNNRDDPVRILFLPEKGPPEVKELRVTLNQMLERLEEAARLMQLRHGQYEVESSDSKPQEAAISADEGSVD